MLLDGLCQAAGIAGHQDHGQLRMRGPKLVSSTEAGGRASGRPILQENLHVAEESSMYSSCEPTRECSNQLFWKHETHWHASCTPSSANLGEEQGELA